jgi:hypothetical protein
VPATLATAHGVCLLLWPWHTCYPIGDLTAGSSFGSDQLIQLLQQTVAPDNWESAGGNGTILATPSNRTLVVSTTEPVHQKVAKLLAKLRTDWDPLALAEQRKQIVAVIYPITAEKTSATELLTYLQSESSGIKWDKTTAGHVVGNKVVIRHRAEVHPEIRKLIDVLLDANNEGGYGGHGQEGGFGGSSGEGAGGGGLF